MPGLPQRTVNGENRSPETNPSQRGSPLVTNKRTDGGGTHSRPNASGDRAASQPLPESTEMRAATAGPGTAPVFCRAQAARRRPFVRRPSARADRCREQRPERYLKNIFDPVLCPSVPQPVQPARRGDPSKLWILDGAVPSCGARPPDFPT